MRYATDRQPITSANLELLRIKPADDFSDFYQAQYPKLAGSLRVVCGDGELASDLAQEAFARALARWDRLRHYDQPAGWLYRTAFNLLRRHWKRQRHDEGPLNDDISVSGEVADRGDLVKLLAALPYRQRQAIVLRYILDYSTDEVAEIMEVRAGAVRMTLHRGVEALRDKYGFDPGREMAP